MSKQDAINLDFKKQFEELGRISQQTKGADFLNKLKEICILGNKHLFNLDITYKTVLSHAALDLLILDRNRENSTLLSNFLKSDDPQVLFCDVQENSISIHLEMKVGRKTLVLDEAEDSEINYFNNRLISEMYPGDTIFLAISKESLFAFSTYGKCQDFVRKNESYALFNLILEE